MSEQRNQRNPEEIEADIAQHRERLDESLEELEERYSPQQLINRTFDYVRHGGANEFAANLSETIKQNPAPFLITSVGLGWLIWSSQRSVNSRPQSGNATRGIEAYYPSKPVGTANKPVGTTGDNDSHGRGRTAAAKEKAQHMSDKAQHMSGSVKDRAREMSDGMRERTSRVRAGSRNAMHGASSRAQNLGQQTTHFIKEHPVMAGALGIAVGAAIGSLLPSTRTEDERMGGLRDKAVDRATEEGERYAEEARAKVHEKAEQVENQDTSESGSSGTGGASKTGGDSASREATTNSSSMGVSGAGGDTASRGSSGSTGTTSSSAIPPSSTTPGSAAEATEPNTTRRSGVNGDDSRSGGNR
ncbi:DUF3618 domain-containing protein [Halomonas sp. HP20-15]|uniref:DUF3618 domain-containing protein n=1 Tax=Halomonas sp. HP20-15 TaxID=3085901 RepID=UPI002980EE09|nr:DUF3618 domain-containing protein [Halomonas sp. HP20-15]MDW5375893.1 DUF3618 domain-containing protein [Halomonas sp. HP20-15]